VVPVMVENFKTAQALMIKMGAKAQQNPGSEYWRCRFVAARERWESFRDQLKMKRAS